jgi:hypothetical protein
MRADENAPASARKAELPDQDGLFDPLNLVHKDETAVSEREQIDECDEEKKGRNESWHIFKTP